MQRNRLRNSGIDWLLLALIIPGLLSALLLAADRYSVEKQNRTVELTLDYSELQSLSFSSGTPIKELLQKFKEAGVISVAVEETLLGDLVSSGEVSYEQRVSQSDPLTIITVNNPNIASRVFRALIPRLGWKGRVLSNTMAVRAAPHTLNEIGIGLPPDIVVLINNAGLDVVARLVNYPTITEEAISVSISELSRAGITHLICSGSETIGFKGLTQYAAGEIKSAGLVYGSVEFAKQKGDAGISRGLGSNLVRVHSISHMEMMGMQTSDAVERFVRAARERNIRLCYIRLAGTTGGKAVDKNLGFVSKISKRVQSFGFTIGSAEPFGEMSRPEHLLMLMILSVAAAAVLLLSLILTIHPVIRYSLLIIGVIVGIGLSGAGEKGLQLLALNTALIFPTLGIVWFVSPLFRSETSVNYPIIKAVGRFAAVSITTLLGALLVVGFLADRAYMVKVLQFTGIKAAHLLPIMVVAFLMVAGMPIIGKPLSEVWADVKTNLRKVASHPLFVWHALAVAAVLGIIGIALMRTGNEPGFGVSSLELSFRTLLDKILVVRPRTKEFMIGHPAMLMGIGLLLTRRRNWGLPLVGLGILGQVSLLNTFCHIHTPLTVSLIRAINGLVLGVIIGLIVWILFCRLPKISGEASK